ncbi:short-chain dehydrogenase [Sphingobium sp. SCG-1]|uniref:SDR family NAD(P)-dependent oxidoreductase n=1 Tax=Sphingobium sp. SCG-1 TaxID=2072936 RepID=UPI000CD68924|nr:SDR family oxidoreductase [Sphingobium sp. SCG-1]AUW59564.1 short-chain dehydrogenase [Sphingobium sp. SCG-1]
MVQRTALIIGASSEGGLGEATTRRLVADGYAVILAGRNRTRLDALAADLGARAFTCDLLNEQSISDLARDAGPVDVLVNAAGTTQGRRILKITRQEIEPQLAMHVTANILLMKHFGAIMPRGGSIVLFSSVVGKVPGFGLVAYAAAKAALDHVVRVAALEFGPMGIRVNAVAPGFSRTPMTEVFLGESRYQELYSRETAMGKLTEPHEVAAAVSYLASPDCYSTGEIIQVSGGAQLLRLPRADELQA